MESGAALAGSAQPPQSSPVRAGLRVPSRRPARPFSFPPSFPGRPGGLRGSRGGTARREGGRCWRPGPGLPAGGSGTAGRLGPARGLLLAARLGAGRGGRRDCGAACPRPCPRPCPCPPRLSGRSSGGAEAGSCFSRGKAASCPGAMPPRGRLPVPLPRDMVLRDTEGKVWRLGSQIGQGGFGLIYLGKTPAVTNRGDVNCF